MKPAVVSIVYYSMYGHVATLAQHVKKGAESLGKDKITAKIYQVNETLPPNILQLTKAPPKDPNVPVIQDPKELLDSDAIIFGVASRYGMLPSQLKAFFDSTGGIWATGGFVGKIGSAFVGTSCVGGGQETSILTMLPFFTHHGMLFAPLGYTNKGIMDASARGGSPWGVGTVTAPDMSRKISDVEKDVAFHQGKQIAEYAYAMKKGKSA